MKFKNDEEDCIILGLLVCFSCKDQPKKGLGREGNKATAVFFIDKKRGVDLEDNTQINALKVYADVSADGTFKVLSFCKPQSARVKSYIYKRVEAYTIRRELMEEAYIKPGEQYLILRYQPDKIK